MLNYKIIVSLPQKLGATSKIEEFKDLKQISSFGFRGEALNSLNYLSNMTMETRTQEDLIHGWKVKIDPKTN